MAEKEIAIKVTGVSKTFHPQSSSGTIKEVFIGVGRKLTGKSKSAHHKGDYTALKDISFEVNKGDFFGIVGRNGSGKSTLLKILAGVYTPTKGAVQINGKLTPFIELGVGFNPELSGRDNVFLNGALLGFTRRQMEEMYDDIVDFAELHDFMDTKLKNYSSGMQVRLAFSVAIRAESDILLIDEVLAVGDTIFQNKCFEYFKNLKKNKKTVVFVSHDMESVKNYCNKAIFINDGKILMNDTSLKVANKYNETLYKQMSQNNKQAKKEKIKVTKPKFNININNDGPINFNDWLIVKLSWPKELDVQNVGIAVFSESGYYVFGTNSIIEEQNYSKKTSAHIEYQLRLGDGEYYITVGLFGSDAQDVIDFQDKIASFKIAPHADYDLPGDGNWRGLTKLNSKWR